MRGIKRFAVSSYAVEPWLATRSLMLTFSAYIDTIPLSATNAAGGTRVIGVGCRYYTTLRRGVFIAETRSVEAT